MSAPDLSLLGKRRFAPLFVVQFLGAFNDNLLKFALLFLANFVLFRAEPEKAGLLATIATGLFILPYFLFSALAGQIADAWDKAKLVRAVKAAEIVIMTIALLGFWLESVPLLLACLFFMGLHSTIFGPVKFSILPQHLQPQELMGGTGLVEAGTFLAILGGQLLGGTLTGAKAPLLLADIVGTSAAGTLPAWIAGLTAIAVALLGFIVSLAVPPAPPITPGLRIDANVFRSTWQILKAARHGRGVWLSILGISWFFAVGAVLLSQFATLVSGVLQASQDVAQLFLLVFSISVALGSLLVNRLLAGEVSARFVPISALALAGFMIDLWLSTSAYVPVMRDAGIAAFVETAGSWRILIDLSGIAFAGGMFIVPLYAILQTHAPREERSRTIAANNILNAAVSVAVALVVTLMLARGESVPGVIGAMGFATLTIALISCWLLPETVIKAIVRGTLRLLYRIDLSGEENMPRAGTPAVVVVNHVSFLDGLLLAAFLPGKPTFAVNTHIAKAWWVKPFLPLFDAFPVDPTNPMAAKAMVKAVREGRTLVIFPEGRITVTGALMKIFDGPGMVADKADAPIIPVRIDGAQYTPFSRLRGKVRLRSFPKIKLTVLPPRRFSIEGEMTARARRTIAGRRLYDEMSEMIFATSNSEATLFEALLEARHIHGGKATVVEDVKREPMSYDRLVMASLALAPHLSAGTEIRCNVGLMMPNVNATIVAFFALQAKGCVAAMLNYTAGLTNIRAACTAAEIEKIVTSRAFVKQAKLEEIVQALEADGLTILWLEDVSAKIGTIAKLRAAIASRFARRASVKIAPSEPAVILFTSGSEGLPKGVVLTHRNLLSNCRQLAARIDFNSADVVLNALPVFHSFGLTGGTLLPILHGVKTLLYPSPLHYRIVPALAYDSNATILFGTDTFLSGYARMAHTYDFYSLRYIFAGAERVRDETRKAYADKFGLRILEGYGATEAGPVIAVNTPMHFRAGTVGRLLPGIEAKLDDVPGIAEGGRLSIRGPNIMAGYMKADAPGVLQPPEQGWHDSGDIVTVDAEGFVTIRGRAKRFAKIGGEMVSLPAVEGYAAALWPDADHAVVTRPDARKGEQLVLFTTRKGAKAGDLQAWGRANGVTELAIPRDIRELDALPVLGTGKLDYVAMGNLATA